jgi:hypothetical protein
MARLGQMAQRYKNRERALMPRSPRDSLIGSHVHPTTVTKPGISHCQHPAWTKSDTCLPALLLPRALYGVRPIPYVQECSFPPPLTGVFKFVSAQACTGPIRISIFVASFTALSASKTCVRFCERRSFQFGNQSASSLEHGEQRMRCTSRRLFERAPGSTRRRTGFRMVRGASIGSSCAPRNRPITNRGRCADSGRITGDALAESDARRSSHGSAGADHPMLQGRPGLFAHRNG